MAHIHNIKNHLSRWLQVHDKEPFEILKHKVEAGQNGAGSMARLHPNTCRLAFVHNSFKAEKKVYMPQIIQSSFERSGTVPVEPRAHPRAVPEQCNRCDARQLE